MNTQALYESFQSFFEARGHNRVTPSPVVLPNDPTLFFVNAGMNQFKDVFLGTGSRDYTRAVNSQPCIRVSGKHNDLETVGHDGYHLTAFEMLGNWSFGDYGKKEAILWAWEWLTQVLKLPKEQMYATVYDTDDESETIWKTQTDINTHQIVRCGKADNFWEMGETGPCGPCSEVHIDRGPDACDQPHLPHVCEVNGCCARYIEVWNLVFIQSNRLSDGTLQPLPNLSVDTGAGLERLAAYMQNHLYVYDTDGFSEINATIDRHIDPNHAVAKRVIADHTRTLCLGIADGVLPSNDGRGYVLRRLLRRAMRYARQAGCVTPMVHTLVSAVIRSWQDRYPHIAKQQALIEQVIYREEQSFIKTLDTGLAIFESTIANTQTLSGAAAFKLYDTYGFPLDLTQSLAAERGIKLDEAGFYLEKKAQQERARANQKQAQENTEFDASHEQRIQTDTVVYCTHPDGGRGGEVALPKTADERLALARHHTATHLFQASLQRVLGSHVVQSGSLVSTERLRFDFTHFQALTDEEKSKVLLDIQRVIDADLPIEVRYMPLKSAKEMGAMALFGQQYPDEVRVIRIADESNELCGGHHVTHTGLLERIQWVSESGISAGVRRIEAVVGHATCLAYETQKKQTLIDSIYRQWARFKGTSQAFPMIEGQSLPTDPADWLNWEYTALDSQLRHITQLANEHQKQATIDEQKAAGHACQVEPTVIQDIPVALVTISGDMKTLKWTSDTLSNQYSNGIAIICSVDSPHYMVVKQGKTCKAPGAALAIIQAVTHQFGGKGGGRPDMAQAGGVALKHADDIVPVVRDVLCVILG